MSLCQFGVPYMYIMLKLNKIAIQEIRELYNVIKELSYLTYP